MITTEVPRSRMRLAISSTAARLRHAERRRRLVHDHELRGPDERARDRDALALAAGERLHGRAPEARDVDAQLLQVLRRLARIAPAVEHPERPPQAAPAPLAAEVEVRDDVEVRRHREVLVEGLDAVAPAPRSGCGSAAGRALDADLAGVRDGRRPRASSRASTCRRRCRRPRRRSPPCPRSRSTPSTGDDRAVVLGQPAGLDQRRALVRSAHQATFSAARRRTSSSMIAISRIAPTTGLAEARDVLEHESVRDHAQQQDADGGADHRAAPARERRAADDHRREDRQQVVRARRRKGATEPDADGEHDARDPGAQAAQHVEPDLHAEHAHARQARRVTRRRPRRRRASRSGSSRKRKKASRERREHDTDDVGMSPEQPRLPDVEEVEFSMIERVALGDHEGDAREAGSSSRG